MLQFYYNFIDKYIDKSDFQLIQMVTDSNFFHFQKIVLKCSLNHKMIEKYKRGKFKFYTKNARNYIQHFKLMVRHVHMENMIRRHRENSKKKQEEVI